MVTFTLGYLIWLRARCKNLTPYSKKLTYKEAISNEIRGQSFVFLWVFEVLSISLALYGVVLLVTDQSQWLTALVMIIVFVACSYLWARMIRIKRRQSLVKQ